ncbi:MAG: hypothetical protein ABI674_06170 [Spartobacteria bacterium]
MRNATSVPDRLVQVSAAILSLIYLTTGLAYLCLDYWSVTQQDFWRIFDICLNHSWLHSAIYKFNGHSLFFPSFIWLADLRFFHGIQTMIFGASLVLLLLSTALLLLPIWKDRTIDRTTKTLATLTIVGVSFWMGRASITTSGGFNCMASFVMLGVAWAFLLLPKLAAAQPQSWRTDALVVFAGFVASFSFGTGLAIWPCLLFLGWSMRLPWRTLGLLTAGALGAGLIFRFLPPHIAASSLIPPGASLGPLMLEALRDFCRLLGAPLLYCTTAWQGRQISTEMIQSSRWLLWSGAAGLLLATALAIKHLLHRDLLDKKLTAIGLGLMIFNLASLLLVVMGRLAYFRELPDQIAAPRYWFWSALFWAGLILVVLDLGTRRAWLRWPGIALALAAPLVGWQGHREEGIHWRYSKLLSEESATGLINGVRDPQRLLFREIDQINILAPQLRAHRLDMFASGFQDWIGQPVTAIFKGGRVKRGLRGKAAIEYISDGPDRENAVRVVGQISPGKHEVPPTMVILNSQNAVVGVARSFYTSDLFNWLLFDNRISRAPFRGYIREYHKGEQYTLRSVNRQQVSEEAIQIADPAPNPKPEG